MTLYLGSRVFSSITTRSIAPGAARIPYSTCAPSSAGPVGVDVHTNRLLLPSTRFRIRADVNDEPVFILLVRLFRDGSLRWYPRR